MSSDPLRYRDDPARDPLLGELFRSAARSQPMNQAERLRSKRLLALPAPSLLSLFFGTAASAAAVSGVILGTVTVYVVQHEHSTDASADDSGPVLRGTLAHAAVASSAHPTTVPEVDPPRGEPSARAEAPSEPVADGKKGLVRGGHSSAASAPQPASSTRETRREPAEDGVGGGALARLSPPQITGRTEQTLEEEVEILERARAQLRSSPGAAMDSLSEHEARFPRGTLWAEREYLMVQALTATQKPEAAREHAQMIARELPSSIYARRLRNSEPSTPR